MASDNDKAQHEAGSAAIVTTTTSINAPTSIDEKAPDSEENVASNIPEGQRAAQEMPMWRYLCICTALCLALFLSLLDSTIVATAIYTLSLEFDSLSTSFWVVLAYTLGYMSFATFFARASDFTGRRPAFAACLIIFMAASLGCGWSPSLNALIACRAIQGLGGSGLYALAIVILVEITPDKRQPMLGGIMGMLIAVAGAIGPLVGGAFTTYVTWRWIFWMNGPFTLLATILFLLGWPEGLDKASERRPLKQFDWVGTTLLIAASSLVVFGLQQGAGGSVAWNSAQVVAALTIGCVSWVGLFIWSFLIRNTSTASAFPFLVLQRRRTCAGVLSTLFTGFTTFTMLYIIPLRFQVVNQVSPSAAGVRLLPLLGSSAFASVCAGAINRAHNRCTWTFIAASCFMLLGSGLMSTLPPSLETPIKAYGFEVLLGAGQGLTYSTVSMMVSFETERKESAVIQGVAAQSRIIGGSIGIAAVNGLLNRQLSRGLTGVLPPALIASFESSNAGYDALTEQQRTLVRTTYADGFSEMMRVCVYVGIAALLASALTWTKNPPHPVGERMRAAKEKVKREKEEKEARGEIDAQN